MQNDNVPGNGSSSGSGSSSGGLEAVQNAGIRRDPLTGERLGLGENA